MNGLFKKYWYLLVLLFVLPVGLNFLLQVKASYSIVGDSTVWLSFWSTYLAGILGSLITLFVLYKTLKQNEASLLKTLSQNEANNDESKKLQIAIYKKGLEERRIQELAQTFKESLHFIDLPQVRHHQTLIKNRDYKSAELFFFNEINRGLNTLSTYALGYITTDNDKNIEKYRSTYGKIINKYTELINTILRIMDVLQQKELRGKITRFKIFFNSDIKNLFSQDEYDKLTKSKNEHQFVTEMTSILDERINEYSSTHAGLHRQLIGSSFEILTHKRILLENYLLEKITT